MYKILIVDDEEEIREAIIERIDFNSLGFELIGGASNGVEAIEYVEKFAPDLIVTDIKMPFMTGIELARNVRELHPDTFIAFLTGYEDFSYAKEAIRHNIVSYLLKPISAKDFERELLDIKSKMDKRKEELLTPPTLELAEREKQYKINSLVMPILYYAQSTKIREWTYKRLLEEGLKFDINTLFVVAKLSFPDDQFMGVKERENFLKKIANKYLDSICFSVENDGVVIFYASEKRLNNFVKISCMEFVESANKALGMNIYVGVSHIVKFNSIYKAFSESVSATEYAKSLSNSLIFIQDIERADNNKFDILSSLIEDIDNKLKYDSDEDFSCYLDSLVKEIVVNNINLTTFFNQVVLSIHKSLSVLVNDVDSEILTKLNVMSKLTTPNHLKRDFIQNMKDIKQYFSNIKRDSSAKLCDDAIAIIEKNFCDPDLSLNVLADMLSCSSPYLSMMIKKYKGNSFINILTEKRMEQAQKLIKNTDLKMSMIAEKTGYLDQHYFSYCFKKYFGISPLKMRQGD